MRTHVHKNSKHTVNSVVCIGGHGVVTSCRLYTQSTYVPFCFNPYLKKVIFFFHSTNVTIDWLLNCLSILLLAQVPLSSARVALKCPCCHRTSNPKWLSGHRSVFGSAQVARKCPCDHLNCRLVILSCLWAGQVLCCLLLSTQVYFV